MKKNIIACFASFFVLVSGLMVLRATNGPDASPEGQLLKTLLQIMTLSSSADETVQVAIRQAAQSQMAMAKDAEIAAKEKKLPTWSSSPG